MQLSHSSESNHQNSGLSYINLAKNFYGKSINLFVQKMKKVGMTDEQGVETKKKILLDLSRLKITDTDFLSTDDLKAIFNRAALKTLGEAKYNQMLAKLDSIREIGKNQIKEREGIVQDVRTKLSKHL